MGRKVARVLVALAGAVLLVLGGAVAALGGWISTTLAGPDSLRTTPETIDTSGCSTVVMEIADVRVDAGELSRIEPIAERSQSLFTIRVNAQPPDTNADSNPFLVGVADQQDVEQRLLGARYCLVESAGSGWKVTSIAVTPDAPDAQFSGVLGRWATSASGETVALPLPAVGSSVVISGSDESFVESLEVSGELEITGASTVGLGAFVGGIATVVVGIGLLMISILGLRSRGRHEGSTEAGPSA